MNTYLVKAAFASMTAAYAKGNGSYHKGYQFAIVAKSPGAAIKEMADYLSLNTDYTKGDGPLNFSVTILR
jgi:hypothetical protein